MKILAKDKASQTYLVEMTPRDIALLFEICGQTTGVGLAREALDHIFFTLVNVASNQDEACAISFSEGKLTEDNAGKFKQLTALFEIANDE